MKESMWGPVSSYVKTENHSDTRNSSTLRHQQTPPPRLRYQGLKRIYVEEEKKKQRTQNPMCPLPFTHLYHYWQGNLPEKIKILTSQLIISCQLILSKSSPH